MIEPDVKVVLILSNFGFGQVVERAVAGDIRAWPEFDEAHCQWVEQAGWDDVDWLPGRIIAEGHTAKRTLVPVSMSGQSSIEELARISRPSVAVGYACVGGVVDERRKVPQPQLWCGNNLLQRALLPETQSLIVDEEETVVRAIVQVRNTNGA